MAEVVDLHDARVVDAGEHLRLALETLHPLAVARAPRLDHLHGDGAGETPVTAFVDPAEGPLPDRGQEFVAIIEGAADEIGSAQHRREYGRSESEGQSSTDGRERSCRNLSRLGVSLARDGSLQRIKLADRANGCEHEVAT